MATSLDGVGGRADQTEPEDRVPTERVIFKHAWAILVPEGVDLTVLFGAIDKGELRKLLGAKPEKVEVWVEVARNTAPSKRAAIRAYAGEPGTPDAKVGTFRAPPVRSWKDAEVYEAPPEPLVTVRTVE